MILFIYCASGIGREVYDLVTYINKFNTRWTDILFVDDNPDLTEVYGIKVYTYQELPSLCSKDNAEFIVASGEPLFREGIYNRLKHDNYTLSKLIHPRAILSPSIQIEEGVVIHADAKITNDCIIQANSYIQPDAAIGHDTVIGKNSVISSFSFIGGGCILEDGLYIAPGALIRDHIRIRENTIIGMGSVVTKDTKKGVIMAGNPARVLGVNEERRVFGRFK